jgi:hypothetical protein
MDISLRQHLSSCLREIYADPKRGSYALIMPHLATSILESG